MSYITSSIRNIVLCGHGSTGKTTLTEQLLATCGAIPKAEAVESGKSTSDYTEEEIARKISIHTSLSHVVWNNTKINILDTPGVADFLGEAVAAYRAAESAVVLIGADVGVQIETVKIWRRLSKSQYPRVMFINKMEKEHADFEKALDDLRTKFSANFVPVTIPIGKGANFKGVIDLLHMKASTSGESKKSADEAIPADQAETAKKYRDALVEAAAEGDDKLIEKFFATGSLTEEEILSGLRKAVQSGKIFPVLCGAAVDNRGVVSLLDFIVTACPAPGGEAKGLDLKGQEQIRKMDSTQPLSCFVFKTSLDQFSGRMSFVKVISGKLVPDCDLVNIHGEKKEKAGKLHTLIGKKLTDAPVLETGDIGVLLKLTSANTNDTLCAPESLIKYEPLSLPQPVHGVAISALSKKEEDKLNQLLLRAGEEDPTFKISFNVETKETVVSCMGELHLSIVTDKIKHHQKIEIETHIPKIAYRETLQAAAAAEFTHKKQTGGHGQYAKVVLEIAPLKRGGQFSFVNAIFGGAISKGYVAGVEKGVIEGMEHGFLAGYPIVDLEARVVDGKEHPVDSSEMAFKLAARGALKEALEKARPVLLEPVMKLVVYVDEGYLGDILSDISSRRGKVLGQEPIGGGILEVRAQVPQAELLRYSIDLKSMTSGTGSFEMDFDHYNPIAGKIAEEVIKAAQVAKEEAHA
jgi:elongation factor G